MIALLLTLFNFVAGAIVLTAIAVVFLEWFFNL